MILPGAHYPWYSTFPGTFPRTLLLAGKPGICKPIMTGWIEQLFFFSASRCVLPSKWQLHWQPIVWSVQQHQPGESTVKLVSHLPIKVMNNAVPKLYLASEFVSRQVTGWACPRLSAVIVKFITWLRRFLFTLCTVLVAILKIGQASIQK